VVVKRITFKYFQIIKRHRRNVLFQGAHTMKRKYIGIIICVFMIIAVVLPGLGTGKQITSHAVEKNTIPVRPDDSPQFSSRDEWILQWSHEFGGNGHAQFAQPVGDINDDGINEIIMGGYENSGICRIYQYNTTQQTYVQLYSWSVAGGSPSGACVVDLDGDGTLEFCVSWTYGSANGVYAYKWDGTTPTQLDWYHGSGTDFVYDIYACDYNDDGNTEVLVTNDPAPGNSHVTALGWNSNTNTFYYETSWTCPTGSGMAVPMVWSGDVDNDGKTEVIADVSDLNYATAGTWALNWNANTQSWHGVPVHTNYPSGTTVFGDGVGDVNNDGTPEIGVGSYGGTPAGWLFEWNGTGYEQIWHGEYPGQDPVIESVAIGDADNDGNIEFCFGTGNVHIIGWNGSGYYEKATLTGPTNMLAGLIIGDCDSDGRNEVKGCEILGGTGSEFIWKYQMTDTTPPVTTCMLQGDMFGTIYVSNVTVTLTATDNESGVASTKYKLDAGAWTTYTTPFIVSEDGNHTVSFYSVDRNGNVEEEQYCSFIIQQHPPLNVTMKGGKGISVAVENQGLVPANKIPWSINLVGGIILTGRSKTGIIPGLMPGENTTLTSSMVGFGRVTFNVTVGELHNTVKGFVFLFFVWGVK
jgi:hypothetical protein